MGLLDGIALVTGAGSGIGRDCAIAYAVEGALGVVFADINLDAAQNAANDSKKVATNAEYRAVAVLVDVTQESSVNSMVQTALDEFKRIDYSVNSAGIGVRKPQEVSDVALEEFDKFYHVNVRGTLLCVRAVTRAMKEQDRKSVPGRNGPRDVGRGVIINLGSCNSYIATPKIVQYASAKHAVMGITKSAALDNAQYGIRVNAICPSWVDTPMVDQAIAGFPPLRSMIETWVPLGRIAEQEEISDVIMFLSSHKASYVTGVGWLVDGGTTLTVHV